MTKNASSVTSTRRNTLWLVWFAMGSQCISPLMTYSTDPALWLIINMCIGTKLINGFLDCEVCVDMMLCHKWKAGRHSAVFTLLFNRVLDSDNKAVLVVCETIVAHGRACRCCGGMHHVLLGTIIQGAYPHRCIGTDYVSQPSIIGYQAYCWSGVGAETKGKLLIKHWPWGSPCNVRQHLGLQLRTKKPGEVSKCMKKWLQDDELNVIHEQWTKGWQDGDTRGAFGKFESGQLCTNQGVSKKNGVEIWTHTHAMVVKQSVVNNLRQQAAIHAEAPADFEVVILGTSVIISSKQKSP